MLETLFLRTFKQYSIFKKQVFIARKNVVVFTKYFKPHVLKKRDLLKTPERAAKRTTVKTSLGHNCCCHVRRRPIFSAEEKMYGNKIVGMN